MSNSLLSTLIYKQAERYGDNVVLKYRDYEAGQWLPVSWKQFAEKVKLASNALVALGVGAQENVGVFSQNMPECLYTDFGAFGCRIVTIPLYATSSEAQVTYIVEDASISVLFVGEQYQYDVALRVLGLCNSLKQIVIFDPKVKRAPSDTQSIYYDEFLKLGADGKNQQEVDKRTQESRPDDLANILYTSGTTGESKGVMLRHSCYEAAFSAHNKLFEKLGSEDVVMNFLPYSHIFERAWTYWCLSRGCQLAVNLRPQDIQKTIKEIRPTAMCSVPRFWEKVYAGVLEKINETTGLKKNLMLDALKVGKEHNITYLMNGKTPPALLHLKYKFYEKTIYNLLKKTIGIENGNLFPTAGAAIPLAVEEFVHSVGIGMVAGYGLTESTATVSCEWPGHCRLGSVGKLLPGLEMKIGENNEILLRGETIIKGYYKKDAITKAAFTEDGWFRTGDLARIDKNGYLYISGRKKFVIVLKNGKNVYPEEIESLLEKSELVKECMVFGMPARDGDVTLSVKICYDKDYVKKQFGDITIDDLKEKIWNWVKEVNKTMPKYKYVKKLILTDEELVKTTTLKIKRNVEMNKIMKSI